MGWLGFSRTGVVDEWGEVGQVGWDGWDGWSGQVG